MPYKVEYGDSRHDAQWVATVWLTTGKTMVFKSDFRPSHWDTKLDMITTREKAVDAAALVKKKYGVGYEKITVTRVTRATLRLTEERTSEQLYSTLTPEKGEK